MTRKSAYESVSHLGQQGYGNLYDRDCAYYNARAHPDLLLQAVNLILQPIELLALRLLQGFNPSHPFTYRLLLIDCHIAAPSD